MRSRTTVTWGDSLDPMIELDACPCPANALAPGVFPDPYAVRVANEGVEGIAGHFKTGDYLEAQIHGGLSVEEAERVVVDLGTNVFRELVGEGMYGYNTKAQWEALWPALSDLGKPVVLEVRGPAVHMSKIAEARAELEANMEKLATHLQTRYGLRVEFRTWGTGWE